MKPSFAISSVIYVACFKAFSLLLPIAIECLTNEFYKLESKNKTLIVSTASPYKFTRSVMDALGKETEGTS